MEPEDAILVERSRAGDRAAFETLVRRHANLVGSIAYNIVKDMEAARDAAQETFLKVHRHLDRLEEPAKFKAWVSGIARTTSIDWLRRTRVKTLSLDVMREHGGDVEAPPVAELPVGGGASLEREELYERVLMALNSLPAIYREVMLLKHLRRMSYKAIAEFLNLSPATVESRLYRAKLLLKDLLGNMYPER
ncbi:MAG: sigma-70 family RNA polymerase sigma factor [Planctomycetes bacterium]|nr:sigma-70 family RNA polymerase sigma factor [Planctomycetota bacterium]